MMNLKRSLKIREIEIAKFSNFPHGKLGIYKKAVKDVKEVVSGFEDQLNADLRFCKTKEDLLGYIKQLQINYRNQFGDFKND